MYGLCGGLTLCFFVLTGLCWPRLYRSVKLVGAPAYYTGSTIALLGALVAWGLDVRLFGMVGAGVAATQAWLGYLSEGRAA